MNMFTISPLCRTVVLGIVAMPLALAGCHRNRDTANSSNANPPANPQVTVNNNMPPPADKVAPNDAPNTAANGTAATQTPAGTSLTQPPSTSTADTNPTTMPGTDNPSAPSVPPPALDFDTSAPTTPSPSTSTAASTPAPSTNRDNMNPSGATSAVPAPASDNAFAIAELRGATGAKINGTVKFMALSAAPNADIRVIATIADAPAGEHGIHVHDKGDCSAFAAGSAGTHWNPANEPHGGPTGALRHAGDLGNIVADANGAGMLSTTLPAIKGLADMRKAFIGKAVIVHEKADDLTTQPSGNSGTPIACGVIKDVTGAEAH